MELAYIYTGPDRKRYDTRRMSRYRMFQLKHPMIDTLIETVGPLAFVSMFLVPGVLMLHWQLMLTLMVLTVLYSGALWLVTWRARREIAQIRARVFLSDERYSELRHQTFSDEQEAQIERLFRANSLLEPVDVELLNFLWLTCVEGKEIELHEYRDTQGMHLHRNFNRYANTDMREPLRRLRTRAHESSVIEFAEIVRESYEFAQ